MLGSIVKVIKKKNYDELYDLLALQKSRRRADRGMLLDRVTVFANRLQLDTLMEDLKEMSAERDALQR